jgi:predicted dehydrogenase
MGLVVSTFEKANKQDMRDSPIRLAVVGSGSDVATWQDVSARLQGGCIAVLSDSMPVALKEHQNEFDAVVIQNPLADGEAARRAAEANKHVFISSPVAKNLSAAEAILEACNAAGICFGVAQTLRYKPSSQTILDRLSSGKLGDPGLLRVHRWRSPRNKPLAEWLFPDIELAARLFGAKPTEVFALARQDVDAMPGYVQVHLGYPAGGMAIMDFSASLPAGEDYDSLSLIGSCGAAYADDHRNTHLLYGGGDPSTLISGEGNGHVWREIQTFVDAVRENKPSPVGDVQCRTTHQVIGAVAQSLEAGRVLSDQGGQYEPV